MTTPTVIHRETRHPVHEHGLPRPARRAVAAMYIGLALTIVAMVGLVVDLASTGVLVEHLGEVYEEYTTPPSEIAVAAYLLTYALLGVLGWLGTIRAVRRQGAYVRPLATTLLGLATIVSIAHLTLSEYGQTILPIHVGLAGLLPCVAGLVAVVCLWSTPQP